MKLKTGTKISFIFSIFTFLIIFLLLLLINIYTFLNWYNSEKKEISEKLINEYEEIIKEYKLIENQKIKLLDELEEKKGFIGDITGNYSLIFLDIYKYKEKVYIMNFKDSKFGRIYIPYDITNHFNNQIDLLYISFFGLLFFGIFSFFISKYLFIKFALKDIFLLVKKIQEIDLNNIKKINLNLKQDDEIYEIINNINRFLELIKENTNNLKEFNTNVAHEFKTPLMIISSQIEYNIKTGKYKDGLEKIEKQIDILNELLETFLFISKVQNSNLSIKLKDINISDLINNIVGDLEKIYISKNIKITKNINDDILLNTDEKLFLLIIKNLIDNSLKYTPEFGKIEIFLDEKSFKIKDNGIGISKDKLENIFDNFYRETNDEKGFGIGLNIVKKVIDILNYKILIKTQKGIGSEFEIKFQK
ncbi:MAG: HAMP domain-containing sensor histidine kinase [Candidatus Gracilibacteria bacterium]|nr:HAMP domain-containing sensor histidine kinase [Candidatus Gracilibacteria bacterium]